MAAEEVLAGAVAVNAQLSFNTARQLFTTIQPDFTIIHQFFKKTGIPYNTFALLAL
jgi:hypothetical protein